MSPPLPLIHSTCCSLPSSGSCSMILELVLPPPKFVIRRSEPSRLERYLRSSAPLSLRAISLSQRSSRYRRLSCTFTTQSYARGLISTKFVVPRAQQHYLQK